MRVSGGRVGGRDVIVLMVGIVVGVGGLVFCVWIVVLMLGGGESGIYSSVEGMFPPSTGFCSCNLLDYRKDGMGGDVDARF